jgi:Co/Zn/Cd efflux system component
MTDHDDLHEHEHHDHDHDHDHDHGPHGHSHPTGIRGFFYGLFVPHSHDAADSIDDALEASTAGVRALKISLFALLATAILQLVIFIISDSVALLADTIHNFADALTAVPLGRQIGSAALVADGVHARRARGAIRKAPLGGTPFTGRGDHPGCQYDYCER